MTTEHTQSDIAEVRDQLSLDFADSQYLNVIGRNLGMSRPILGFTDDSWRAVVKILALEYKQIANKFRDVLKIIFGPRVTEVATLAKAVAVGDVACVLNDTSNLPQLGTLVFDEGSTSEETLPYCYIDRVTNTVYLEGSFGEAHSSREFDAEDPLLVVVGTRLVLVKTNNFPTNNYPYPVVLGRGTVNEEVVQVVDNDQLTSTLTLLTASVNPHAVISSGNVFDQLHQAYFPSSSFVALEDSSYFPEEGYIKLFATGDSSGTAFSLTANTPSATADTLALALDTFLATRVTVTDVEFVNLAGSNIDILSAGSSLPTFVVGDRFEVEDHSNTANNGLYIVSAVNTVNADYSLTALTSSPANAVAEQADIVHEGFLSGYEVVFSGNITSALAGVRRRIISNTDSFISLDEDFTGPGSAPAVGDEFSINPIAQYIRLDYGANILTLRRPILETNFTIPLNSTVELMVAEDTVALSSVKSIGTGWDIIQTTPRLVELLIPEDIRDPNDLRSSSHIHDDTLSATSTTNSVQINPTDTTISALSFATFPDAGTVDIDPGGGSAERQPYGKAISEVKTYVAAGAGIVVLVNSRNFPSSGSILLSPGTNREETLAYSANATDSGTLTLTGTTTNEHRVGEITKCTTELLLQSTGALNTHAIGTTIEFYQPKYALTTVPIGDFNQQQDTWPGPYLYSLDERAATATVALTNTTSLIPGTTLLLLGQGSSLKAIEVGDGLSMLEGISIPFDLRLGAGSSREETVKIDSIALKGRASTTISTTNPVIGSTSIQVAGIGSSPSDGDTFPSGGGYRIVINEAAGVGTLEVAYVIGTRIESGPTAYWLDLEDPLTIDHPLGATVDLMADVLEIQAGLMKTHDGFTARSQRSTVQAEMAETGQGINAYASLQDASVNPELVQPLIGGISGGITLASTAGLDITGGNVIFNFGNGALPVETTIAAGVTAGATTISVDSSDAFPAPTLRFTAIIGAGTPNEERVLVNANNIGTDVLTIGDSTYGTQYAHSIGETVRFEPGAREDIEYSEVDGAILRFNPEIVLQYTHYPVETVVDSSAASDPADNGYDFPFRMPIDILVRLQYLLDIVRAAGVQVELITQR